MTEPDTLARFIAEREEAGLPRHVEDESALAQVAALLDGPTPRSRRRAARHAEPEVRAS